MDSSSDVEVISIDDGESDADAEDEIFTQEPQDDDEEEEEATIGQVREEQRQEKEETTTIGEFREERRQKQQQHHHQQQPPLFASSAAGNNAIDLTVDEPRSSHGLQLPSLPVVGFREEYDELLEGADGAAFHFEAVAELLLRFPEHWWCR